MAKPRIVEDEYGEQWAVYSDDPVDSLLNRFNSLPNVRVVLPRGTIISGEVTEEKFHTVDVYHPNLESVILRNQRLIDCINYLRG